MVRTKQTMRNYIFICCLPQRMIARNTGKNVSISYHIYILFTWRRNNDLESDDIEDDEGAKAIIIFSTVRKCRNVYNEARKILGDDLYNLIWDMLCFPPCCAQGISRFIVARLLTAFNCL